MFLKRSWPFVLIFVIVFLFFNKLFFPLSVVVTPDYGRSDSWHLSIANKFYFAMQLKEGNIPIWNPQIGGGFPTFSEGQTGVLFPPNLILFRLLQFPVAYNLAIVAAFVTTAIGTYLFLKSQDTSRLIATSGGLIFSLSSFFIFHVQHLHLIQTASLMPFLFWATHKKYLLVLSFVVALQIFAGFPQITVYSILGLYMYLFALLFLKSTTLKYIGKTTIFIALGLLLAAIQIIPTYEFLKTSERQLNAKQVLSTFPYKPINLLQFFDPFALGSPKNATYARWQPGKWGIFWENSAYVGIAPLSLAITFIIIALIKRKAREKQAISLIVMLFIALMLSLGLASPLHPVFSIPPLSIFRVPSRFLLLVAFAIVVIASLFLKKIKKGQMAIAVGTTVVTITISYLLHDSYNLYGRADAWFDKPQTAQFLKKEETGRIISFGQSNTYNEQFLQQGWKQGDDVYLFLRNSLDQNSNLIFAISQIGAYESIQPQRAYFANSTILNQVPLISNQLIIPQSAAKLLASRGVTHIVSTYPVVSKYFTKTYEVAEGKIKFYVYQNLQGAKRVFIASKWEKGESIAEISNLTKNLQDPTQEIIVERKLPIEKQMTNIASAYIAKETSTEINILAESKNEAVLVLTDSYFPGWEAKVNGKNSEIFPVNINSRGLIIPRGKSNVTFSFEPKSLKLGTATTASALVVFLTLAILKYKRFTKWQI